jgi:hypothetical protein
MIGMTRRNALIAAAGLSAGFGPPPRGSSGVSVMQAVDFERARISWITKDGTEGSWRVIATARPQDPADCIYLAPAVMAGKIFGAERLPLDPPYSYQLIATRQRHAIVREDEVAGNMDSEADHDRTFLAFDIHAPMRPAMRLQMEDLNARVLAQDWPVSVRLSKVSPGGSMWALEFPASHINTRSGAVQVETGPVLVPRDVIDIAGASVIGGCYLAYVFFNRPDRADLLAWGPGNHSRRGFVRFARLDGIEAEILARQP